MWMFDDWNAYDSLATRWGPPEDDTTEVDEVVVVGKKRLPWEVIDGEDLNPLGPIDYGPPDFQPDPPGGVPGEATDDDECPATAGLSAEAKREKEIDAAAASIMREILAQPDSNIYEYGALIYVDDEGNVKTTALTRGTPTSVPNMNMAGISSYAQVVGIVHSHPSFHFDPAAPLKTLFPSANHLVGGNLTGDWMTYDWIAAQVTAAGGDASDLRQYIAGYDGTDHRLMEYDGEDRDNETLGEEVDRDLRVCGVGGGD